MKPQLVSFPMTVDNGALAKIKSDVETALRSITTIAGSFVINDTLWYHEVANSAKPTVMNSASYITAALKTHLRSLDWKPEAEISGQRIDAFKSFPGEQGYQLTKEGLLDIVAKSWNEDVEGDASVLFSRLYRQYYERASPQLSEQERRYAASFLITDSAPRIKVGLEFETGNIASSFRALSKLDTLYKLREIDVGVFITSIDKASTATRIWPVSNRNGSFEELTNRNYKQNVEIPLVEYGFSPDSIDPSAPYLGSDGNTFVPTDSGKTVSLGDISYRIYLSEKKREILLPA